MYLTAHRVQAVTQVRTGINAVLYRHDSPGLKIDWSSADVGHIADYLPGRVACVDDQIPAGGNLVISFVDLVAADDTNRSEMVSALDRFGAELAQGSSLPLVRRYGDVGLRFDCQADREDQAKDEFAALRERLLTLYDRWSEGAPSP